MEQMIPELSTFDALIRQQAWKCYNKLPKPTIHSVDNLKQEAALVYAKVCGCYDPAKAKFITLFFTSMQNHFTRILKLAHKKHIPVTPLTSDFQLEGRRSPIQFEEEQFNEHLSEEANDVVGIYLHFHDEGKGRTKQMLKERGYFGEGLERIKREIHRKMA